MVKKTKQVAKLLTASCKLELILYSRVKTGRCALFQDFRLKKKNC